MGRVIAEVTLSPLGTGTPSLTPYVAAAIEVLGQHPEVTYQLHAMGTILEGERADIIRVVEEMTEAVFSAGAQRVGTVLRIDERRDKPTSMAHKVEAVERELGG
jgi:uncharacterized protein (TIGR00106 family)